MSRNKKQKEILMCRPHFFRKVQKSFKVLICSFFLLFFLSFGAFASPPRVEKGSGVIIFYRNNTPTIFLKFCGYNVRMLPFRNLGSLVSFLYSRADFLGLGYRYDSSSVPKIYRCLITGTDRVPELEYGPRGLLLSYSFRCKGNYSYVQYPRKTAVVTLEDDRRKKAFDGWNRIVLKIGGETPISEAPTSKEEVSDNAVVKSLSKKEKSSNKKKEENSIQSSELRESFMDDYPRMEPIEFLDIELHLFVPYLEEKFVISGKVGVEKVFYVFSMSGKPLKLDRRLALKEQIFEYVKTFFPGINAVRFQYVSEEGKLVEEVYVRSGDGFVSF